jgi:hypothetical protein
MEESTHQLSQSQPITQTPENSTPIKRRKTSANPKSSKAQHNENSSQMKEGEEAPIIEKLLPEEVYLF